MSKLNDPPARPGWLTGFRSREERATWLIREHIARRIEISGDKLEVSQCRAFLRAFDKATSGGNSCKIGLAIGGSPTDPRAMLIYGCIPRVGRVVWLPMLVLEATEKLADIWRQHGPLSGPKVHPTPPPPRTDGEPARRRIPPKVDSMLIPGRNPH